LKSIGVKFKEITMIFFGNVAELSTTLMVMVLVMKHQFGLGKKQFAD
jgi:hypothetical protein